MFMLENDFASALELFDLGDVLKASNPLGLARQIRERRLELGWSQSLLAEKSKVSQNTISRIELGEYNPTYQMVKSIVEAMKLFVILDLVSADVLLARAEAYKKGIL